VGETRERKWHEVTIVVPTVASVASHFAVRAHLL